VSTLSVPLSLSAPGLAAAPASPSACLARCCCKSER
jgi:hypothetical protein